MTARFYISVVCLSLTMVGCQSRVSEVVVSPAVEVPFHADGLSFTHPQTGHVFKLRLGEEVHHDTGGITEVPANIRAGQRDATTSYYEPVSQDGSSYAVAESLYRRDFADIVARNSTVQYRPDSGRLLITEDKSDGLPCRRYILYTLRPGGGYEVSYLAPPWESKMDGPGMTDPPDINLLPDDHAKIGGTIMKVDQIERSSHPFSLGG